LFQAKERKGKLEREEKERDRENERARGYAVDGRIRKKGMR